ncbi:hypothetical protein ACQJBY_040023 [Aegilops geniculata]
MPFVPPADSLYHRYFQAHRRVTWDRVRVPDKEKTSGGIKVLPPERDQKGLPTCIYEAMMAWMESHLRLNGIIVRLSSKDLQDKEQALVSGETDRTVRCMEVVSTMGILSEDDYKNQNLTGVRYVVDGRKSFFSLNQEAIERAVETMRSGPLLLVFHCGEDYFDYIAKYKCKPILSYKKYRHEQMLTHAVNCIGYGVETIVPSWEFQNSYGKKLGPRGRLLPQNAIRLYGMTRIRAVLSSRKRKRMFLDDPNADFLQPPLKKRMLELKKPMLEPPIDWMDIDDLYSASSFSCTSF